MNRRGAIGTISFSLNQMKSQPFNHSIDSLLIVAGDTLFTKDFDLAKVIEKFNQIEAEKKKSDLPNAMVLCYQLENHNEVSKRGTDRFQQTFF